MKLKFRNISASAREGRDALAWVEANAEAIALRANADGYSGFGPGGSGRHSGISDPTASGALRFFPNGDRTRPTEAQEGERQRELTAIQFRDALGKAREWAVRAENLGHSLMALSPEQAKKLAAEIPADAKNDCANPACRREVQNTPVDRLRHGRCEACYRYRLDHHGNERPRELCNPPDVAVGTSQ